MRLRARIALLTLVFTGIGALAACGANPSATATAQKPLSASSRSATRATSPCWKLEDARRRLSARSLGLACLKLMVSEATARLMTANR